MPWRRRASSEGGQTLVEFCLVCLVFFLLVFGIFDGTRLFESWVTVQHAAREAARYAVTNQEDCDSASNSRTTCIMDAGETATSGLNGGGLNGADVSVSFKSWDYPNYTAVTTNSAGVQCDAIQVTVSYQHHFILPMFQLIAPDGMTLNGIQRMVNEPFGPCS